MRISVLHHKPAEHLPTRPGDPTPTSRNLNPLAHPFSRARERTRALNAAKLDRIFAKPFIDSLEGHIDAVEVLVRQPGSLTTVASGSWDGTIIVHDIAQRIRLKHIPHAHKQKVSGICFTGVRLLSCGVDRTVKLWDLQQDEPLSVFSGKTAFK